MNHRVQNGSTDLLSFGRLFIANPDLPRRLAMGAPLAHPDMSRAYGGDETGYTDYPPYPEEPGTQAS